MSDVSITLDSQAILRYLPHRYPFLLIDQVVALKRDHSIVAIKNVTINEPFFQGHFPGRPIMPGVLILEAMAQTTGLLALYSYSEPQNLLYLLAGIDKVKFKTPVLPGHQLQIEATAHGSRFGFLKCYVKAKVENNIVCTAEITGKGQQVNHD